MTFARSLRWIAVIGLFASTLLLYRPRYGAQAEVHLRGYELFAVAESLVQHHAFADPFLPLPTGPTAHVGPVYPAYLALVFLLFGHGPAAVGVLLWGASLLFALQMAILPALTQKLHLGFWTGVIAAIAWLAARIPPAVISEVTITSFLVIAASFLMADAFDRDLSSLRLSLWAIVWAALLLLQPAMVLVLFFFLLLLHFLYHRSPRQKLALALLPILLVSPWIARNYLVFHKLFFIRDNLGMEMAVSNRDCATALFDVNDADHCFAETHPNENYAEALCVRELGEIEYNRVRMREALDWINSHPRAFAQLSVERFQAFWFPPVGRRPGNGVILLPIVLYGFTLLSIPGLFIMWRNVRSSTFVAALWLVFCSLITSFNS